VFSLYGIAYHTEGTKKGYILAESLQYYISKT
jgi:hypothetical protein